jgi:acetylornithine deacetylase/succinyl-diaminopimelate desuccinylase-like protein
MPSEIDSIYARVFENHHEGVKILEDLIRRYGRNPWVKGGIEAQRETDKRLGNKEVLDYIVSRINRAHGVNDHVEDSNVSET